MKNKKKLVLAVTMLAATLLFTSCGVNQTTQVNTKQKSVATQTKIYLTKAERDATTGDGDSGFRKTKYKGKTYYMLNDERMVSGNYLPESGAVVDKDKFIIYNHGYVNEKTKDMTMKEVKENYMVEAPFDFFTSTFTFNKKYIETSGLKYKGNKKTAFNNPNKRVGYVIFTKKAANCKKINSNISKKYTNKERVKFTTPGVITKYKINGKNYTPAVYYTFRNGNPEHPVLHRDYYDFTKNKEYKIQVTLSSGYTKTFTYVYDDVKPAVNVKTGKKYESGQKIVASDKNGIRSIKLNGKSIKNETSITKVGKHTLKVTDNAGNTSTINFSIYK